MTAELCTRTTFARAVPELKHRSRSTNDFRAVEQFGIGFKSVPNEGEICAWALGLLVSLDQQLKLVTPLKSSLNRKVLHLPANKKISFHLKVSQKIIRFNGSMRSFTFDFWAPRTI